MNKKRNLKVELLRIISILLVITNHSVLNYYSGKNQFLSLELFSLIGVTVFFMITGFFLYDKQNNTFKVYRNCFFRVFIPFAIFSIIVILFENSIDNKTSFIENIYKLHLISSIKLFLKGIKQWTCTVYPYLLGHTWYIFDYIVIIILFPLTYYLINKLNKKIVYLLLILYFLFTVFVDLSVLKGLGIYNLSNKLPKATFLTFASYIFYNDFYPYIYNKIIELKNKKIIYYIYSLSAILILFLILFNIIVKIQKYYDNVSLLNNHFPYYFRYESFLTIILCFIFIILFFLIVDLFKVFKINYDFVSKIVLFFSRKTFLVYLIHAEIIVIFQKSGIANIFISNNDKLQILYNVLYIIVIYSISIMIVAVIEFLTNKIKILFEKTIGKNMKFMT